MKYKVITICGGVFWAGWSRVIGEYRWLWMAKIRAMVHVNFENRMREAIVITAPPQP